eukprot:253347-Amphidinium_carterae.1
MFTHGSTFPRAPITSSHSQGFCDAPCENHTSSPRALCCLGSSGAIHMPCIDSLVTLLQCNTPSILWAPHRRFELHTHVANVARNSYGLERGQLFNSRLTLS